MVIAKRDESIGWSLQNFVIENVVEGSKAVWNGIKSVGNFFYSIGSSICDFVSPFIDSCVDAFDYVAECGISAARKIKEKAVEVVKVIADTEIVKMATQTVKDISSAVGEQITNAAQAVGDAIVTVADRTGITAAANAVGNAAITVGNAVGNATITVGNAIADTKVFIAAKQAFKNAMNTAKHVYQRMSAYVTAATASYLYYNQCRSAARRLAIEQRGIVDEHLILRSYDQALLSENRVQNNDNVFEQVCQFYF
jgi:hypothetical protein